MMHEFSIEIITRSVLQGIKCFRYLNYLDYVSERGKMFDFCIPAFSLGVKEGWIGEKILCDLPRHSVVMAKIILSIPLFLSTHLDGKLFSSANEWTQIQVGKNTLSHLKETVKISLSHLLFIVWKVTHGIDTGESLSKRTNHSSFPCVVTHFFCPETKPRKKMLLSLVLISSPANRERCWNTRQLNQWERKCWCYQSDLPWEICCNMNAA